MLHVFSRYASMVTPLHAIHLSFIIRMDIPNGATRGLNRDDRDDRHDRPLIDVGIMTQESAANENTLISEDSLDVCLSSVLSLVAKQIGFGMLNIRYTLMCRRR